PGRRSGGRHRPGRRGARRRRPDLPLRPDTDADGRGVTVAEPLAERVALIEDRLDIGQLPIRYALAVDECDVEAWVSLFVPDIQLGPGGRGREALRRFIIPQLRWFYRSVHQIVGHRVELLR